LHSTLGHTGYYRRFIKIYANITTPLENILKKLEVFQWTPECDKAFDILKEKVNTTPILIFPNWENEFHVHVHASGISLGAILAQPRDGAMDHPIYFARRKLSQAERNYTTTEKEGLAMIYALRKFRHYFLGSHFKFFTDHSALKYLVNKLVLEGRICLWLLLFQEFSFEVIIKPGRCNVGPDHLSRLESGESGRAVDDQLLDADMFRVEAIPKYLKDITIFLSTGVCPETCSATQKCYMVVRAVNYKLIMGKLYKLGLDSILKRCVVDHERQDILWECHSGVAGGHVGGKATVHKVLQAGLWWATLFKDEKANARSYDVCQRVVKPS
jgi:hypothetical protein